MLAEHAGKGAGVDTMRNVAGQVARACAVLACLLAAVLCVLVVTVQPACAEDTALRTRPQLSCDDVAVVYGTEPFYLDVSTDSDGAISYVVRDEDIVTVDEDGLMSVCGHGTTYVRISVEGTDTYRPRACAIEVTVAYSVEAPVIYDVICTDDAIAFNWTQSEAATGYGVYRKSPGDEKWTLLQSVGASSRGYTDTSVQSSVNYYYKVRAYGVDSTDYAVSAATDKLRFLAPTQLAAESTEEGVQLTWTKVAGASGYYVYRDDELIATVTSAKTRAYHDDDAQNGSTCAYGVTAYYNTSEAERATVSVCWLAVPTVKSASASGTKLTATWSKNAYASGYQLQYSTSPLFASKKTVKLSGASTVSTTLSGLSSGKTYYVRVRAYRTTSVGTSYSAWAYSGNVVATKSGTLTRVTKSSGASVELRALSGQSMYGYDTVQGACTDGTYAYYVMYKRSAENCKIVKVKLSTMSVVKVSGVLDIDHGNGITYNSDTGQLVVTHTRVHTKRVSFISTSTLTVLSTQTISLYEGLADASESDVEANVGYTDITYNSTRKQYALLLRSSGNIVICDEDLAPVRYITLPSKDDMLLQGLDSTDDFLIVASSFVSGKNYNMLSVYTWSGELVTKVKIAAGYELEAVYHVGSTFYIVSYRSYYATSSSGTRTLVRDNYVYTLSI